MTVLTWLFFTMSVILGYVIGRYAERKTNKKLMRHVRELVEEAKANDQRTKTNSL